MMPTKVIAPVAAVLATLLSADLQRAAAADPPAKPAAAPAALPKISIGSGPVTRTPAKRGANWEARRVGTMVDGKRTDVEVIHLRGIEGIEAADIPEAAKAFFLTHAKALPPDEVAHYVVNKKQLEDWARTHPMPEALKKKKEAHRKRGCKSISMKCAREGVKHVSKEVSKQAEALRKEAREDWKDVSRELGRGLKMAEGALRECFADHRVTSGPIPVDRLHLPGKVKLSGALVKSTDGKARGTANVSLPITLENATVEVSAFIIPCAMTVPQVPLWIRPRSVSLKGTLTVNSHLDLELNASGAVHDTITLLHPTQTNFFTTVFFIHAVPFELDLGVEFESKVLIQASGAMQASLCDARQRKVSLDFQCDGKGCRGRQQELPVQFQPVRNLQVAAQGQALVRPSIFTAFTLDVNFGALSARVGPEFYVAAEVRGAGRGGAPGLRPATVPVAATLAADLYGGVDMLHFVNFLRPEFLDGKSAAQVAKGRDAWMKTALMQSVTVGAPSAAGAIKTSAPRARCAK
jgi:hypothetical protein